MVCTRQGCWRDWQVEQRRSDSTAMLGDGVRKSTRSKKPNLHNFGVAAAAAAAADSGGCSDPSTAMHSSKSSAAMLGLGAACTEGQYGQRGSKKARTSDADGVQWPDLHGGKFKDNSTDSDYEGDEFEDELAAELEHAASQELDADEGDCFQHTVFKPVHKVSSCGSANEHLGLTHHPSN